jgi:mercuric ion binding protein
MMRRKLLVGALSIMVLGAGAAFASERTATLAVDNMTCASCPYIVKETMAGVPGVSKVVVSLKTKTAVVTFDDAKTGLDAIAAASAKAGYPARPVGG